MTLNKKNQYASNEHSLISGYLDAVVDINCKMNVISDYDFYKIDPDVDWITGLNRDLEILSDNKWFSQWEIVEQLDLDKPLDALSDCLLDWIFVFLGTGSAFGGFSESGFRAIDMSIARKPDSEKPPNALPVPKKTKIQSSKQSDNASKGLSRSSCSTISHWLNHLLSERISKSLFSPVIQSTSGSIL